MPEYVYGDYERRSYPDFGIDAEPGDTITADEAPDFRWTEASAPPAPAEPPAPEPDPAEPPAPEA